MRRSPNFGVFVDDIKDYVDLDFNDVAISSKFPSDRFAPSVIEGVELLNTLCPVSKFTGCRENPLSLLGKITGADSNLLNSVLQELPVIASDSRLSDSDRVDFLVSRLGSGTPAEDAILSSRLMNDLDALGLRSSSVKSSDSNSETAISFDSSDVSSSD